MEEEPLLIILDPYNKLQQIYVDVNHRVMNQLLLSIQVVVLAILVKVEVNHVDDNVEYQYVPGFQERVQQMDEVQV